MFHSAKNAPSLDRSPTAAEQAAVRWVTRCDCGLDEAQRKQLNAWLEENRANRELFEEFGGTWALLGQASELRSVGSGTDAPVRTDVGQSAAARIGSGRSARRWALASLAAAAAIVMMSIGLWRHSGGEIAAATAVGGLQRMALPDGSVVKLNTDSAVTTAFTPTERRVRLVRGEAFFEVAKNRERPFIVEAAGVGVRAVGTAFNVRLRTEAVEVLVTEGKVRVAPEAVIAASTADAPDVTHLVAGERVVVPVGRTASPAPLHVAQVSADEAQRLLAWHDGRLDFSDTPLSEMVAEFNRYNVHKLAIGDAELGAMRFGGSFRPDDRVGFVRMLRETFGLRTEESGSETILLRAR